MALPSLFKSPNWSMSGWQTGQPSNLFQSFGLTNLGLKYPQLNAQLPSAVASSSTPAANEGTSGTSAVPQSGALQSYARNLLGSLGWTTQWTAFNSVVNAESGWNPKATNPSSGAFGIAQALGHGTASTQGTITNQYGGYGLTDAQARAANSGNGLDQILWMVNYIKDTYGDPANAWAHEQSAGWY